MTPDEFARVARSSCTPATEFTQALDIARATKKKPGTGTNLGRGRMPHHLRIPWPVAIRFPAVPTSVSAVTTGLQLQRRSFLKRSC